MLNFGEFLRFQTTAFLEPALKIYLSRGLRAT